MKSGNAIVQGYRLANQVHCHVVAAELVGDDAKKMEAIDVILIDRQDFPVVAFSFGKSAGLVMPQRRGQQLGNLMRGVDGCAGRRSNGDLLLFRRYSSLFSVHSEGLVVATSPNDYCFGENDSNMFVLCAIFLLPTEFFRAPTELLSRGRAGGLVDLLSLLGASVYLDLSLKNDASLRPADEEGLSGLAAPALAKLGSSYGPW